MTLAQTLFLGEGKEVNIAETLEFATEVVALFVRVFGMFFGLLAGNFECGAPLAFDFLGRAGGGGSCARARW